MAGTKHLPPYMFNLEGNFLGYLGTAPNKQKALVLDFEQEQLTIKLPKSVRTSLQAYDLQMGDPIQCIGRSQVDLSAGIIKLKAYYVMPLNRPAPAHADDALAAQSLGKSVPVFTRQKRAKILVCRKSGCQKRGARQLGSTLEALLQEYQLRDYVEIQYTGCQKRCSKAPTLTIMPGKHRYDQLALQHLPRLVQQHFCPSQPCSQSDS